MLILVIDDICVCNMQIAIHTWALLRSVKSLLKERDQVVISPGSLTIFFLKELRFFSFFLAYSYKCVIIFCLSLIFISFLENFQLSMVLNRFDLQVVDDFLSKRIKIFSFVKCWIAFISCYEKIPL